MFTFYWHVPGEVWVPESYPGLSMALHAMAKKRFELGVDVSGGLSEDLALYYHARSEGIAVKRLFDLRKPRW